MADSPRPLPEATGVTKTSSTPRETKQNTRKRIALNIKTFLSSGQTENRQYRKQKKAQRTTYCINTEKEWKSYIKFATIRPENAEFDSKPPRSYNGQTKTGVKRETSCRIINIDCMRFLPESGKGN
jgi:hypothetical protein